MRFLVGTACVAIIAMAAVFFGGFAIDAKQQWDRAQAEERRHDAMHGLGMSGADRLDPAKTVRYCQTMAEIAKDDLSNNSVATQIINHCKTLGYLRTAD